MKINIKQILSLQIIAMVCITIPLFYSSIHSTNTINEILTFGGLVILSLIIGHYAQKKTFIQNIADNCTPIIIFILGSWILSKISILGVSTISLNNELLFFGIVMGIMACSFEVLNKYFKKLAIPISLVLSCVLGYLITQSGYSLCITAIYSLFYILGRTSSTYSITTNITFDLSIHSIWFVMWILFITTNNMWFYLDLLDNMACGLLLAWIMSDVSAHICSTVFPNIFGKFESITLYVINRLSKLWNIGFYILLFITFNYLFYTTTTFTSATFIPSAWTTLYRLAFSFILIYAVITILQIKSIKRILFSTLLLIYAYIHMKLIGTEEVVLMCATIVAAHNKSFKGILSIAFWCGIAWYLACIVCSYLGIIPLIEYPNTGPAGISYALGIMYRTDAMAHFMFLFFISQVLFPRKMNIIRFVFYASLTYLFYYLTYGKTGLICIFGYLVIKFIFDNFRQYIKLDKIKKLTKSLIPYTFIFMLMISLLLIYFSQIIPEYSEKFRTFFTRPLLGYRAITEYPMQLFGTQIPEVGNGGTSRLPGRYFYIDNFYIRMLMKFGILFFVLYLLGTINILKKSIHKKNWTLVFVLMFIALDGIMEHHLADFSYNIFMCLLFTSHFNKSEIGQDVV